MVKRGFVRYAPVFRCGRRICSMKTTDGRHVGLLYASSYLNVFVIISCFGQMVKYVEFQRYLRSADSSAQMYSPS